MSTPPFGIQFRLSSRDVHISAGRSDLLPYIATRFFLYMSREQVECSFSVSSALCFTSKCPPFSSYSHFFFYWSAPCYLPFLSVVVCTCDASVLASRVQPKKKKKRKGYTYNYLHRLADAAHVSANVDDKMDKLVEMATLTPTHAQRSSCTCIHRISSSL